MLPEFMDVTFLERMSWAVLIGLGLLMLLTVRIVTSVLQKIVALVLLFGLVVSVWVYREDLDECRRTCSCSVAGFEVDFPPGAIQQCQAYIRSRGG
jgi:hypothetical protein